MREELTALASDLVAIDSRSPNLVPGAPGERDVGAFVARWLERAGFEVELEEAAPGRPNVIGTIRGSGSGRTLLLNAHMDTVGFGAMDGPLAPRVDGDLLYGRGAYDMKASLAAIMIGAREAAAVGLAGDLVVTAVADEEFASVGSAAVARSRRADAAIVAEPTELDVAVAHRGFVSFDVETRGHAAHGSRPDLGVDAIVHMGYVLAGLGELDRRLREGEGHPLVGTGSLHAGTIEGGEGYSTYPPSCLLRGERRTRPGETPDTVRDELEAIVAAAHEAAPALEAAIRIGVSRDPFAVDESEEIVELVRRHAGANQAVGVPFWTDAALLQAAGIPTVVFGPVGEGAHADVEWVDLASIERVTEVLVAVAREFCS